jgi:hypothetical protein
MARIRTIKPEFWTDEKVVELSPLARLLFVGIWNFVDDFGRVEFSSARLKMQIFPADSLEVSPLLQEIENVGLIILYDVDGKRYLQVTNFRKHQAVKPDAKEKHPSPPEDSRQVKKISLEKEKEKEKESAAADAASVKTDEADYFTRAKAVLKDANGGLAAKLFIAKGRNVALARSAIEMAATKSNPREYVGAIIRGADPPERTVDPRL